ncbi:hypothetical protein ACIRPK_17750 [Kitasatospora sp. NPDC101801]|uniref:hypothetical protein n=1 Tax=Kitasatospora sp. NPDC101801 TaxID=3364103 RepID=UPI0037FF6013
MATHIQPKQYGKGGSPCGGPGQPPCPKKKSEDEPEEEQAGLLDPVGGGPGQPDCP